MDPVKMRFALAFCLLVGLAFAEPVLAQFSKAAPDVSATVDGVRGRCGLGLLAQTTSSQTCQSFKDYGSRMQCVADDLSDGVRAKESPVFAEVANCYRALGNALVAGRGANNDQVNALEDICRKLRHETVVPRSTVSRDVLMLASDALMPEFSRSSVQVPTVDPMRGIRLHDLPDCALALALPPGPASMVTSGPNPVNRTVSGVMTGSVQAPRFVNLSPPGADVGAASAATPPVLQPAPQAAPVSQAESTPSLGEEKLSQGGVDRTIGKSKGRIPGSEMNASAPITESAVINALPAPSAGVRKASKRTTAQVDRSQSGYTVKTVDHGPSSRASSGGPAGSDSKSGLRSSNSQSSNSAISASLPPSLPLMGPPLKPQTAGSVR